MVAARTSRKLAVVLHADVAGSTSLVQRDESIAHERIQDTFRRLSETVRAYLGIAHELRGDALVAEFSRASDAVSAALCFQAENARHNDALDDEIRAEIRIGISLGEVIVADGTLTGPDVVLAQRIEQLARPGGICVSSAVQQAVPRRMPFDFEDLGEQQVKGLADPVRVFVASLRAGEDIPQHETAATSIQARFRRRGGSWIVVGVVALLLALVGALRWLQPWQSELGVVDAERTVVRVSDKPSIAVLAFTNMSDDPTQEYFAEGIADDIITDLSKVSGLFVIARNSSFSYKGRSVGVVGIARDLGVKYVLEGSVRRAGDQIRINAQLVDATTGGHLWAERYDGTLADVFALQDQVTEKIVRALAVNLTSAERVSRSLAETKSPRGYEAFLKGWAHYQRQTPEDYGKARDFFLLATELDPEYSRAFAALAALYWDTHIREWHTALKMDLVRVKENAYRFRDRAMIRATPLALVVASEMLMWRGRHDEAVVTAGRAIELAPSDAHAHLKLAEILVFAGRPLEALEFLASAVLLDPLGKPRQLYIRGLAEFGLDRFDVASDSLETALELNPEFARPGAILVAAYGHLGRVRDAADLLDRFEGEYYWVGTGVPSVVLQFPYRREKDKVRLAQGLRRAGVKEYY